MALQSDCAHFIVGKPNVYVCLDFALASAYEMLSVEEESMVIMSHVDLEDLTCCRLLGQCAVSVKECWAYFSSHSSH